MPGDEAASLDDLVRRVDPDRWLTSRFIADRLARADAIALYAFDHELDRARRVATEPLAAEIRLTWWRETLEEIFANKPVRRHPTAEALARTIIRRRLPAAPLEAIIEGAIETLEAARLDEDQACRWAERVEGSLGALVAQALDPATPAAAAAEAGRAWGLATLVRTGRVAREMVAAPLRTALAAARADARSLSPAALPAALPARLARYDLAGRAPGPVAKRLSLILAVASGSI